MDAAAIFSEALILIRQQAEIEDWPSLPDLKGWSDGSAQAQAQLYDELAAILAKGYAAGDLSFDEGDHIANQWWSMMLRGDGWSNLFHEVYEAFDDGEWSHFGKWHSDEPVKDYTDPAIAKIVARLEKSQ